MSTDITAGNGDSVYIRTANAKMVMDGEEYYVDEYSASPQAGERDGLFDKEDNSDIDSREPVKKKKNSVKKFRVTLTDRLLFLRTRDRRVLYAIFGVTLIGVFWMLGILAINVMYLRQGGLQELSSRALHNVFKVLAKGGLGKMVFIMLIASGIAVGTSKKYYDTKARVEGTPKERSIDRYDSNDFMNHDQKELLRTFDGGRVSPNEPVNIPLFILNDDLYCIPDKPKYYQFKNMNMVIMGSSGSGKTFAFLEPLIMTKILVGDSFVCSDTKGDLYRKYSYLCEAYGYDVWVFNTSEPQYSDAWNCFKDIVEADDTDVENAVNSAAETIIQNTGNRSRAKTDDFWTQNEQNLLVSLLFYVCKSKSYTGPRTLEGMMIVLQESSVQSLSQLLTDLPENDYAYIASAPFRMQEELKVRDSTLSGLKSKLRIFTGKFLSAAMSYDGIDFEGAVRKKTAIFLITSDNDPKYDVVTSLFVTMLYTKLMIISSANGGNLERPFWLILDEICNMASINALSRKISTNRSRNVHFIFAIQSIPQMDREYPGLANNIISNCSTWVTPGVIDDDTAMAWEKRCGKIVRYKKDDSYHAPPLTLRIQQLASRRTRWTTENVPLVPAQSVKELDNQVLVCIAGKEPILAEPYPSFMHPLYDEIVEVPTERIPPWVDQFLEDHPGEKPPKIKTYTPSEFETADRIPAFPHIKEENKSLASVMKKLGARGKTVEGEEIEQEEIQEELPSRSGTKSVAAAVGLIKMKMQEEGGTDELIPESAPPGESEIQQDPVETVQEETKETGEETKSEPKKEEYDTEGGYVRPAFSYTEEPAGQSNGSYSYSDTESAGYTDADTDPLMEQYLDDLYGYM